MIPRRFIRIWLGKSRIPSMFDEWWTEFERMHQDYEFITLCDNHGIAIPERLKKIYEGVGTYAGRSDILRIAALFELGGIYVDTDVMPLKSFDPLVCYASPFLAKRSSKSFEIAVIGSPKGHRALTDLMDKLPEWYESHVSNSASVQTGPAFVSRYWFGRPDIVHLPIKTFYPFNGFMAPKREDKMKLFADKRNFPKEMYAAHFSNHRWGGRPSTV